MLISRAAGVLALPASAGTAGVAPEGGAVTVLLAIGTLPSVFGVRALALLAAAAGGGAEGGA